MQFSGGSDQSNLNSMESSARGGVLKGSRSRGIPHVSRETAYPYPLWTWHRQMERQVVSNQRMTSAPAASTFRQQFQDRGRISEYDASVSRKDGQHGNRHGLLPRPSSRQRASRGRKHVGKVVDNNRLHGFMVGHKDSTEFSQGSGGGNQINQRVASQVGADNFQGASNKSEITDFLNSWNRIGRARPKTSDASRQRRQRSQIPKVNSIVGEVQTIAIL